MNRVRASQPYKFVNE